MGISLRQLRATPGIEITGGRIIAQTDTGRRYVGHVANGEAVLTDGFLPNTAVKSMPNADALLAELDTIDTADKSMLLLFATERLGLALSTRKGARALRNDIVTAITGGG
jgi:hypothetical protein